MKERRRLIKINLIAREARKKKRVSQLYVKNLPLILGLVIGIAVALGMDYVYITKVNSLKAEVSAKKRELKELSPYVKKLKEVEAKLNRLKKIKSIIEKITTESHIPLKVVQAVESSIPYEVWLYRMKLDGKRLNIKGYSLNDEKIADFIERLERNSLVARVGISYIKKVKVNNFPVKEFNAEVIIR